MEHIVVLDCGHEDITRILKTIRKNGSFSILQDYDQKINYEEVKGFVLALRDKNILDNLSLDEKIYNYPVLKVICNNKEDFVIKENQLIKEELNFTLENFINSCKLKNKYSVKTYVEEMIEELKKNIKNEKVLLALSGGVDSSVVCALLSKAIGKNLTAIFVNHGLLRLNEEQEVINNFKNFDLNFKYVDASDRFLNRLKDILDPEEKRKIIGDEFINVFVEEAKKIDDIQYLAQGTIYPDIIESGTKFHKVIKSHHNVGGLPEKLNFKLIEPLKMLFKDEVREVGKFLGLNENVVNRQPFPGPGLGVRCLNGITKEKLLLLKKADHILTEEIKLNKLDKKLWQYFCVFPSIKAVGMRNNKRSYEETIVIRLVNSIDAMSAKFYEIDYNLLRHISYRISHEVEGICRVLYDITDKPLGTIEFE